MIFLLMCTSWMASVAAQHQGLEWCQMESDYVFLLGLAPVQTNWLEQPIWLWPMEHGLNDNVLRSCTIGDQPCTMHGCKKGILGRSHSPSSKQGFWYFAEKKENFAGFSGANSRKNRPISQEKIQNLWKNRPILRDFRGKKSNFKGFLGANS